MAETLNIPGAEATKKDVYISLIPQLEALVKGESDLVANTANIVAALKEALRFFWVGIYFVKGNELVLGPFQGPVACTRIGMGKGVCGTAWKEKRIITVSDVNLFPGHIACNAASKSEIVLPVIKNDAVDMVLDIDSDQLNAFDEQDEFYLSQVIQILSRL